MKENLKKFVNRGKEYTGTNILFFTFIITSVINGVLTRNFTVENIFAIKPLIADLVVVLVIGSFAYFMKPKYRFRYFFIASILLIAICMINTVYYKNYLSFASISLLTTLSELGGYTDAVIENILELKDFIYLWQLFGLVFIHLQLKKKNYYQKVEEKEIPKIRFLNTIVVTLILLGLFISMLTSVDISRLRKQWNREYVVQEFGIYVYQFNDVITCVRTQLNSLFGYDEAAKAFREYYADVPDEKNYTNMYTNLFKDKNVIVIHAESIQNFLISDDLLDGKPASFNGVEVTPNLNKLASEGIYFSNFYSQESAGTSSDTEFTFNASLLPSSNGTVFMNYFDREYVTIPKMLKEMGYYTFSMHGNKGSAWNRTVVHPRLGYDDFYYYNSAYELNEDIGLGLSDKSFFSQSVDIIKNIDSKNDKWYGLLIMLTNHTPFSGINDYGEETGWEYEVNYKYEEWNSSAGEMEEITANYMEGTKLGNYFKSSRYADEAIGELIEKLDEEGLLDDTVIIIYGDHDAKLRVSEFNRYYNYDPYTNSVKGKGTEGRIEIDDYTYELNRSVPFIIWSKDLAGTKYNAEVTTVMGVIDAQPTIGNMFGFYNKYALGNDIFSVEENVVVFPSGNWLTNKLYYNSAKNAYKQINLDEEIPLDYINKYTEYADQINTISNSIITYDLIRKIGFNIENELLEEKLVGEG
jgi:Phosphoglycerol transferase and related proteins, alkaline phosphatase superfamily